MKHLGTGSHCACGLNFTRKAQISLLSLAGITTFNTTNIKTLKPKAQGSSFVSHQQNPPQSQLGICNEGSNTFPFPARASGGHRAALPHFEERIHSVAWPIWRNLGSSAKGSFELHWETPLWKPWSSLELAGVTRGEFLTCRTTGFQFCTSSSAHPRWALGHISLPFMAWGSLILSAEQALSENWLLVPRK